MFGLSKQERVAEALRRATAAALTGAFLHPSQIESLDLNNAASSWIYTESLSHLIFCLGLVYSNSQFSNESWATHSFFNNTVSEAITIHEREQGLSPGTVNSVIFNRINELILIYQGNVPYQHIRDSAIKAADRDPSADTNAIFDLLQASTHTYIAAARKMF